MSNGASSGIGAGIGAAVGSIIPGVGTAIGGAVGGLLGWIGGLFSQPQRDPTTGFLAGSTGNAVVDSATGNTIGTVTLPQFQNWLTTTAEGPAPTPPFPGAVLVRNVGWVAGPTSQQGPRHGPPNTPPRVMPGGSPGGGITYQIGPQPTPPNARFPGGAHLRHHRKKKAHALHYGRKRHASASVSQLPPGVMGIM